MLEPAISGEILATVYILSDTTDETFEHLFFSCPVVKRVHCRIMSTALGIVDNDDKKIWFGFPTGQLKNTFYC